LNAPRHGDDEDHLTNLNHGQLRALDLPNLSVIRFDAMLLAISLLDMLAMQAEQKAVHRLVGVWRRQVRPLTKRRLRPDSW